MFCLQDLNLFQFIPVFKITLRCYFLLLKFYITKYFSAWRGKFLNVAI